MSDTIIYILLMIVTTNGLRLLPMLLIRGEIKNTFVRNFLYYVPYVTLAVMTFPAIMETTDSPLAGLIALLSGIVAAWYGWGLFPVSILCCVIVFIMQIILQ